MPTMTMPADKFIKFMSRLLTFCEKPKQGSLGVDFLKIYESNGELYGESTDRYRALIRRTDAATVDAGFEAVVKREDVEESIKTISKQLSRHAIADEVTLDVDDEGFTQLRTTLLSTGRENIIAFEKEERTWPRVRELVLSHGVGGEVKYHRINTNLLKDLGIRSGKSGSTPNVYIWRTNKPSVILFAGDENEIGLMQTLRLTDAEMAGRMAHYPNEWMI